MSAAAITPLIVLAVCFIIGMPVAYAMILCVIPYFLMDPYIDSTVIIQRLIANTESTSMMAAPFFIIAGCIMNYSGVTTRLMDFAELLVGNLTGGLGHVNILLSTLMGGISGSGLADAAMESKLLVPEMEKRGYSKSYSCAVTAASSVITPIIPPGVSLIVYAVLVEVSVGKLLCAGYLPGLLLMAAFMVLNHFICKKKGYQLASHEKVTGARVKKVLRDSIWALIIPFVLVLGLRVGAFTATEGGALIAVYSLIIGMFVYKELKPSYIPRILRESAEAIGPVLLILCSSNVFSYYLSWESIPQILTKFLVTVCGNKYVFLLLVNLLMLVIGMFLDSFAAMLIVAPLLAPVAAAMGINLVHFGLMLCLNITIGCITPPFGSYLFVVAGTTHIRMSELVKAIVPFILVSLLVLIVITVVPWFSTFIPMLVYGSV